MNNIGVLATNADTEDVYSAVEQEDESKKKANNESNEGLGMFDSDGKQNSEWSHVASVQRWVSLLNSLRVLTCS